MKHAQRTEKYIRLIFNSYISDDDFFQKSMRITDTNYFFSGDFQGALCNPKYGIYSFGEILYLHHKSTGHVHLL